MNTDSNDIHIKLPQLASAFFLMRLSFTGESAPLSLPRQLLVLKSILSNQHNYTFACMEPC